MPTVTVTAFDDLDDALKELHRIEWLEFLREIGAPLDTPYPDDSELRAIAERAARKK